MMRRVSEGTLDLAVVYAPHHRPGLRIELLIEEKLVLVTTTAGRRKPKPASYVYVDWGPEFAAQHSLAFPELSNAAVSASLGPLGREYLLAAGGSGYFRLDVVRSHLKAGRLHAVPDAPEFAYPAYAVHADTADPKIVLPALEGLRHVSGSDAAPPSRSRKR
jgi:DNA-binding transcriptional LysR family regulator